MKNIFKKILDFDTKYEITETSAAITFYAIISISSFSILFLGLLIISDKLFASFLVNDIVKIIGEAFSNLLTEKINELKLSNFSIIPLISMIYSSSTIINRLTIYTNKIYADISTKDYIRIRISSVLLFSMLILVILGEFVVVFYSKYFLYNVLKLTNVYLNNFITIAFEILMFIFTLAIIYMYLPPKRMKFKKVFKISFLVSISIYILLYIFKLLFNVIMDSNLLTALSFAFTMICYLVYLIIYVIIVGIIYIKVKL